MWEGLAGQHVIVAMTAGLLADPQARDIADAEAIAVADQK